MKRKLVLLLLPLLLVGCGENPDDPKKDDPVDPTPTNPVDPADDSKLEHVEIVYEHPSGNETAYLDEIMNQYTDNVNTGFYPSNSGVYSSKFNAPTDLATYDSLIDLFDYCAFYKVGEYKIDDVSKSYISQDIDNFETTLNNVWWDSHLCVGSVGFKSSISTDKKSITLNFYFNELADSFKTKDVYSTTLPTTIPYVYFPNGGTPSPRNVNNTVFPYQSKEHISTIDVYNSDQLIYALQEGYMVNVIKNSPAENIYKVAAGILNGIIDDTMTDKEKAMAISAWIISHNVYDWNGCSNAAFVRKDGNNQYFPDYMASMYTSFYAEGSLIYGTSVCHAMAKGFALLALMEGLEVERVAAAPGGVDKDTSISSILPNVGYDSHGYCYIKEDNVYYFTDLNYTFIGQLGFAQKDGTSHNFMSNRNIGLYMSKSTWDCVYGGFQIDYFYKKHESEMADVSYDISRLFFVDQYVSFALYSTSDADTFVSELKDYLDNFNDSNYIDKRVTEYRVYQFPVSMYFAYHFEIDSEVSLASDYVNQIIDVLNSRGDYDTYGYYLEDGELNKNLDTLNSCIEVINANAIAQFYSVK